MIGQETVSRIVVPSSSVAPAPIEALRHAGLGRSLGDLEPWDAWLLGPDAPEITTLVRDSLAPWLATIPHSRDMPRWLLTFPGTAPDRSFPAPLGVLWPADLGWRPILNPWSDPGGGVALVELLGDHHELKDVLKELVQRFYTGLVLDPPGVGGLLHEACDDIGAAGGWDDIKINALAQDARALSPGRDLVSCYIQEEPSEVPEDEQASEWAGRPRVFLAFLVGAGPLPERLLPLALPRWAEAVLEPRELTTEEIAAFPRTVHTTGLQEGELGYLAFLSACARFGAIRRRLAIERAAEVLHAEGWGFQLAEEPLADQAEVGTHRLGPDLLLLRHGWQVAHLEGEGTLLGGVGDPGYRWRWNSDLLARVGSPLLGLPFHAPRRLDPRDALRTCEDWTLAEELRQRKILLRVGSKGLLRSRHRAAFGSPEPLLHWALDAGLIRDLRKLDPWAYVAG